jgi:hypothetical protein
MAKYVNLYADQGADYSVTITIDDGSSGPVDITGYSVFGHARKSYSSTSYYDLSPQIINAVVGKVKFGLTNDQTDSMKPGRYVFDIEAEDTNGKRYRVIEGQVEISPGATRNE